MLSPLLVALVAGLLASSTDAITLRRSVGDPKVVGMDIQRRSSVNPIARDKLRRRGHVQATLDNADEGTLYFVNASIGTPAQSVRLQLDTGSSDLWVNTANSSLCEERSAPCSATGTYSANSSSTYEFVGSWFNISYLDGSGASGDYATDTFRIGGTSVEALQFGIGYKSSSSPGVLGVGYKTNEVQAAVTGKTSYNNLPAKLAADGTISSNAYSLWLNDLDANTGQILFGGVNTERFSGTLGTIPIQKEAGVFAEFMITLTEVSLANSTIASNAALAVLLDSGSSLMYLPDPWVSSIYNRIGAEFDSNQGVGYVDCSLADSSATIDFTFSSPTIKVPMNELVLDISAGRELSFGNGNSACLFGIAPAGESTNVLGDTFLRSAYVVYDLANNEISLAQTKFNATSTSVSEIGSGSDAVPDSTEIADTVTATSGIAITNGQDFGLNSGNAGSSLVISTTLVIIASGLGALLLA